jgi:hypothetical protein
VLLGVTVNVAVAVGVAVEDTLGVEVGIAVDVAVGLGVTVDMGVGLGGSPDCAQYLPPVFEMSKLLPTDPPQTIISLPVHTAA